VLPLLGSWKVGRAAFSAPVHVRGFVAGKDSRETLGDPCRENWLPGAGLRVRCCGEMEEDVMKALLGPVGFS